MGAAGHIYVGIDNGISGAVAILEMDGSVRVFLMPTIEFGEKGTFIDDLKLRALLTDGHELAALRVVQEWGQKQPKFGCKTNWAQGYHCGTITTLLRQNGIRATAVNPKEWQREMLRDFRRAGEDTKVASICAAKHFFPAVSLIPPRGRTEHNGISDALLMALWGKRHSL